MSRNSTHLNKEEEVRVLRNRSVTVSLPDVLVGAVIRRGKRKVQAYTVSLAAS